MKNGIFAAAALALVQFTVAAQAQAPVVPASQVAPQRAPAPPQMPTPQWVAELTPQHLKYLDDILGYWEFRSSKVQQYECQFHRWEYDSVFGPPQDHKTYAAGELKYENPDKGSFQLSELREYRAPQQPNQPPTYEPVPGDFLEHWVCDGKSIFEFNAPKKQLIERQLPPEQQGQAIKNGPLPFMFGANKEEIKARYWLRVTTPPGNDKEYWIEAWPKYLEDSQNFHHVEIVIDQAEFLPFAIQVFDRNWNPYAQPPVHTRTAYEFKNRKTFSQGDFALNVQQLNLFRRAFYEPSLPSGWQKVVEKPEIAAQPGQNQFGAQQPGGVQNVPLGLAPRGPNQQNGIPR
ncbi:TIGR03009 domain-containing protein [Blastopirellula sp. JC732]|uniref:TIGR03009 domain-containing protein n=1 Tax=Blastopirellula sediminis TaxID=2894196 RepID=A0A9X1SL39_9BACT|nr:TIGR03009 domain-containing protein [Blastopirellula sediminis]MCC9606388.1 TIGR03009 domain-containing protein [Blastopirellula sediminis]MCC9630314.1 TIGR03009 domain-containing protein [Blastopirellula sediminis]